MVASSTNEAIVQSPRAAADVVGEVAQDVEAAIGVRDFRVEEQRVEPLRRRRHCRDRSVAARRRDDESRRGGGDEVAVARPHAQLVGDRRKERRVRLDADRREAELAVRRRLDSAAHQVGHELHAVADAEDRHAALSTARSQRGAPSSETLLGPPERMMPAGRRLRDLRRRRVERQNLGIDGQLAKPARNQLRELRAEIEDDDGLMRHVRRWRRTRRASPIEG